MEKVEYHKMSQLEDDHWWFVVKEQMVLNSLLKLYKNKTSGKSLEILDIGCGTGKMMEIMENFGHVVGIDNSDEALKYCRQKGFKNYKGNLSDLGFKNNSFDLITCLDVIEHIPEDEEILKECYRILQDDGFLFITVPAYQFLWSHHDVACHHQRRYTKKELKSKVNRSGFEIIRISYSYLTTFPPLLFFRFFKKFFKAEADVNSDLFQFPAVINKFIILLFKFELKILQHFNLPFGSSIFCIARKNNAK